MERVRWFFADPRTGRIVIAQWPNTALWIYIGAAFVRWLSDVALPLAPAVRGGLTAIATLALGWWAVDEVFTGVSRFRRVLGAVVLAGIVAGLVQRLVRG